MDPTASVLPTTPQRFTYSHTTQLSDYSYRLLAGTTSYVPKAYVGLRIAAIPHVSL